jgi:hypothetical protein
MTPPTRAERNRTFVLGTARYRAGEPQLHW